MIPTVSYLRQKFDEFNTLCFGGALKPIPILLTRARTYAAQLTSPRHPRSTVGSLSHGDGCYISYSVLFDRPESEIEDVLIHEMIHYYILANGYRDTSPHGKLFKQLMNHINARFGRHITISIRTVAAENKQDLQVRQHLVCVMTFSGIGCGVAVVARSRIFRLWDKMNCLEGFKSCEWWVTDDPYFNRFPRCLTPKAYKADREEVMSHLQKALRLKRDGRRIFAVPRTEDSDEAQG